jgi:hypothetical protein
MREDPEYRLNHKTSNKEWAEAHPGIGKPTRTSAVKRKNRKNLGIIQGVAYLTP